MTPQRPTCCPVDLCAEHFFPDSSRTPHTMPGQGRVSTRGVPLPQAFDNGAVVPTPPVAPSCLTGCVQITYILRDGRELSRLCRDGQRLKLLVACAQALNPSCLAHRHAEPLSTSTNSLLWLIHTIKYQRPRIRVNGATAPLAVLKTASWPRKITLWPLATNIATDSKGYRTSTISNVIRSVPAIDGTCSLRTRCLLLGQDSHRSRLAMPGPVRGDFESCSWYM